MNLRNLWTAVVVLSGCSKDRYFERPISGLGIVRVPERLEPRPALLNDWYGTSFYLTRPMNSFPAMGSNAPQHENLLITQLHPVLVHRRGIELLDQFSYVFEYVKDVRWETAAPRVAYQFRYGTGRYTPNTMDEPAVLAQGFDVARGLAVSYRGLDGEITRAEVEALVDSIMASYKATVDLPTWFSAVERDLGAGVTIALPIELTDPFSWMQDPSGVHWMYFRRYRDWAEDPEVPEQSIAVTAFFEPGNVAQATATGQILSTNADGGSERIKQGTERNDDAIVESLVHVAGGRSEPAWLAYYIDLPKGVGVAYRTWQKNMTADGAAAVVLKAVASYRFTGDSSFFKSKAE